MTRAELARAIGLDKSSMHRMMNGKRRLQLEEGPAIAKALDVGVDEIWGAFGVSLTGARGAGKAVPIVGWLDGSLIAHKEGLRGDRSAPNPDGSGDLRGLRFQTAGSEFAAFDGKLVFYRQSQAHARDANQLIGTLCLVELAGDPEKLLRLREIRKGYERGRFNLASLGGRALEEEVSLVEAHPVVWMKF